MSPLTRRTFLGGAAAGIASGQRAARRPNILFAISDDHSWLHTSASGDRVVRTPAFDRVAEMGVRFTNAISCSPGCAPSRAAILTGRLPWQLEEAGTHASYFPSKWQVYPALLQQAGYFTGVTGKGAGPCNWKESGWKHNPAGPAFDRNTLAEPIPGVSRNDYAANFRDFLQRRAKDQPFCFWYGASEPHRVYSKGIGQRSGKRLEDVVVPPFLPDAPEVRSDILDYYYEIEHFDRHLGAMLRALEESGELANTLIVATGDNGMAFPRAKANMYEYGIHLPLAVAWGERAGGGRVVDDLISFADFAPTFLEAAGVRPAGPITGRSFLPVLLSNRSGAVEASRDRALSGRERHSHARADLLGYPSRALRTREYLYIRNFAPDRWPAGDPEAYYDIDSGPTKTYMMEHRDHPKVRPLFELGFGKYPAEELFDIRTDPACMKNLAGESRHGAALRRLRADLEKRLTEQGDPRMGPHPDIWESYPRFSPTRPHLGGFAEQGKYNPKYQKR
jgi:uncharacterized sulfatase